METPTTRARLPWILGALTVVILLVSILFLVLGLDTPLPESAFGFRGWGLVLGSAFLVAGVLIATRVPANPIGWVLVASGLVTAVQEFGQQYAQYGLLDSPGAVAGADVAAWITEWIWIPYMAAVALLIPMLYPTGRLPSARWRVPLLLGLIAAAIGTVCFALAPGDLDGFPGVPNPVGLDGVPWIETLGDTAMFVFVGGVLAAIVSMAVRYRRSQGDERQQLKWLLLAISLLASSFIVGVPYWTLGGSGRGLDIVENVLVAALVAIPVAIGVAILKYRLYDIDVVIKKTVVYTILAAFITAIYLAIVVGIGTLVGTGGNVLLSAAAAAAVAVAFQPARRRAQRVADRLVYGERATPYEVLSGFSGRLAETYSVDDVLPRMARVLAEGVGAATVTIVLGTDASRSVVARWPLDHPPTRSDERSFDVRHQGLPLGAIEIATAPGEGLDPTREKLVADVAAQAGLVLRNAALIEDLRASRQRLVAAQDEERRRIERNIHDGAQQQLVALAVKLRLADSLIGSDEQRAHAMLAELQDETNRALEDLRDLARGIYPPLLADKGLGAAVESQARKSATPVKVEIDGIGRYPQEAEAAVYFSCLEALQNVAKYADATRTTIRLAQTDGLLTFEVHDDGRGFDPAAVSRGSGLQGIADRLAALGGSVEIRSTPGAGTTITGTLPAAAAEVST
jgi:signal transduction histidine kinase